MLISLAAALLFSSGVAVDCNGNAPDRTGSVMRGFVREVLDGDTLCIGAGADRDTWVAVTLTDVDAPELPQTGGRAARTVLSRATLNQPIVCVVRPTPPNRREEEGARFAICTVRGVGVGDLISGTEPSGR